MLQHKADKGAPDELKLECCPQPVQVMPPADETRSFPLLWAVCGNLLVGTLLIAGLMLLPAFIASLVPIS